MFFVFIGIISNMLMPVLFFSLLTGRSDGLPGGEGSQGGCQEELTVHLLPNQAIG
jgi:hypothetical protein